jgi:hypothetical protein
MRRIRTTLLALAAFGAFVAVPSAAMASPIATQCTIAPYSYTVVSSSLVSATTAARSLHYTANATATLAGTCTLAGKTVTIHETATWNLGKVRKNTNSSAGGVPITNANAITGTYSATWSTGLLTPNTPTPTPSSITFTGSVSGLPSVAASQIRVTVTAHNATYGTLKLTETAGVNLNAPTAPLLSLSASNGTLGPICSSVVCSTGGNAP